MNRRSAWRGGKLAVGAAIFIGIFALRAQQHGLDLRPEPPRPIITTERFEQIQDGMTYDECARLVGAPGVPFGSSASPGQAPESLEWISYRWVNPDESSAEVSFQYNRVARKRSYNLR